MAVAGGYVVKPSNGWYSKVDRTTGEVEDKKYRQKETLEADFWDSIFNKTDFKEFVKKQYQIGLKSEFDMEELLLEDEE